MHQYFISLHFKKQLKLYLKKHRGLLNDVISALKHFDKKTSIALGENTYKIRFRATNLPKGKNKSFRLILLIEDENFITPIAIYFKGDKETITRREIRYHVEMIRMEVENR